MLNNWTLVDFIQSVSFVLAGIILGIIFEKVIFRKLRKLAARTSWKGDEIIIDSLRGFVVFWLITLGTYAVFLYLPIEPKWLTVIKQVFLIVALASVTLFIAKLSVGFVDLYVKGKEGILPSISIFSNLTRVLIILIGFLIILQSLGISITPILTALGVGGLAVALALQDTLSNLFSGLQIILAKQVEPGDYVRLDTGEEGFVTDVTWRNTTIRALANNMIIIPNTKLASSIITNYNQPEKETGFVIQMRVCYDCDLDKVEKVTAEVAEEVLQEIEGVFNGFKPVVRFNAFDDFSINFSVVLRAREFVNQYIIKHEFIKRLHARYQKEGIKFPYPVRIVHMEK